MEHNEVEISWLGDRTVILHINDERYPMQVNGKRTILLPVDKVLVISIETPQNTFTADDFLLVDDRQNAAVAIWLEAGHVNFEFGTKDELTIAERPSNEHQAGGIDSQNERVVDNSSIQRGERSAGAGIVYGMDFEGTGFQVNGQYVLDEKMRISADFIYWFFEVEEAPDTEAKATVWEINANLHYILYNKDDIKVYGIGTIGYHNFDLELSYDDGFVTATASESESELGIGVGGGLEYDLGSVIFYAESRLFLSGFDQFTLSAGLRIPF